MSAAPRMHRKTITALAVTLGLCLLAGAVHAAPRRAESTPIRDPHYGEVLFHFYQQQYFSAITSQMTSQQFRRLPHHGDEAELLLGGMFLSYGLHRQAGEIFQRLIDAGAAPSVRDRAWFYLAKIRYQRGYLDQAVEAMARVRDALPGELEEQRQLLQAQLLMAQQDYRAAAQVLARMRGESVWTQYGRYNLGVALVKAGDSEAGTALLEQAGGTPAPTEELKSLMDKANVALGYSFLRDGAPARAQARLERVRLDGLLSNKALLGMGWAYSAQNQHERSLVPWTELQSRPVIDATVQEALLAVPYALGRAGAYQQSLQHYETAILTFNREMQRIDDSIAAIRSGKMIESILQQDADSEMGWFWRLQRLPDAPESRYLLHLMAAHDFQEALKNYRDLRFLARNLGEWVEKYGVYGDMLATRRQAYAERLPRVLQDERGRDFAGLEARRDRLAAALVRAADAGDVMALANEKELRLQARLERAGKILGRLAGRQEAGEARERYRLLRGLLYADVSAKYPARLWQARKALREIDRELAETGARRAALLRAQAEAPRSFDGYGARIAQLRVRIGQLQERVRAMSARHARYLEQLAVAELAAQKERLAVYVTQARFAVAQMYDAASGPGREVE